VSAAAHAATPHAREPMTEAMPEPMLLRRLLLLGELQIRKPSTDQHCRSIEELTACLA
jgi:hypothetical protein